MTTPTAALVRSCFLFAMDDATNRPDQFGANQDVSCGSFYAQACP